MKYYSSKNIRKKGAKYNVIFGGRSSGKSFDLLCLAVENFYKNGKQTGYIRRWRDDIVGRRADEVFKAVIEKNKIREITKGEWTDVFYNAGKWYLCRYDNNRRVLCERPLMYAFALSSMEHDKSLSFPNITIVIFEEFLSRTGYLPDEFVLFCNVLSTIIRERDDVTIYMLGNTINKYCPYFKEMGLSHVKDMEPGTIDLYHYGESGLTVAVERTSDSSGKDSDVYFAFDNPKLGMITTGGWEIDIYPHCPIKYRPKDIIFTYFIKFDNEILQCEIISAAGVSFTFIHKKTTPLQNEDKDLIFSTEYDPRPNWRRKITHPVLNIEKRIYSYFVTDKVFYQDNEVGEIVRNYLLWCRGN